MRAHVLHTCRPAVVDVNGAAVCLCFSLLVLTHARVPHMCPPAVVVVDDMSACLNVLVADIIRELLLLPLWWLSNYVAATMWLFALILVVVVR